MRKIPLSAGLNIGVGIMAYAVSLYQVSDGQIVSLVEQRLGLAPLPMAVNNGLAPIPASHSVYQSVLAKAQYDALYLADAGADVSGTSGRTHSAWVAPENSQIAGYEGGAVYQVHADYSATRAVNAGSVDRDRYRTSGVGVNPGRIVNRGYASGVTVSENREARSSAVGIAATRQQVSERVAFSESDNSLPSNATAAATPQQQAYQENLRVQDENPFLPTAENGPQYTEDGSSQSRCPKYITEHMKTLYNFNMLKRMGCNPTFAL